MKKGREGKTVQEREKRERERREREREREGKEGMWKWDKNER